MMDSWLTQRCQNGLPVANSVANVALNADGKVAAFSHNFVAPKSVAAPTPKLKAAKAVSSAAKLLDGTSTGRDVELKYYALEDNTLALTQVVELKLKNGHTVRSFVDASSGEVHGLFDFTSNLSVSLRGVDLVDICLTETRRCSSASLPSTARIRRKISSS